MTATLRTGPIVVGLFGASGRMGERVRAAMPMHPGLVLGPCIDRETPSGQDFDGADVVVDFSLPEATADLFGRLGGRPLPLVSGVTGRDAAARARLDAHAAIAPVIWASNFSLGVTLLERLVSQAAAAVEWDAEVFELHHRRKADAPSGTALTLAEAVAKRRSLPWPESARAPRQGGARTPPEVGLSALRGGDVVGEHTVFFCGEGERVELTHRATDRTVFAHGALRAAAWIVGRAPGHHRLAAVLGFEV
jgi:4-hydroxy-tetrahydrodipicolinate reductase